MAKRQGKKTELITADTLGTYFKKRMYEMGISDTEDYTILIPGDHPFPDRHQPIFAETSNGDIEINYPCLYGGFEPIRDTENPFIRTRYKPENQPEPSRKYFQEPKSGIHIFIPPLILDCFNHKRKIKTLYIVEGEFKAFAGALTGLEIIGIGGKDLFTDGEKSLHEDIRAIIRACDVDNLVLLLDADIKSLEWNQEDEPTKDLSKRLYSFYNTVCRFREVAKDLVRDCYFMHLQDYVLPEVKGLDDLLFKIRSEDKTAIPRIIEDILKLTAARHYFSGYNLKEMNKNKLKPVFLLDFFKGLPFSFYDKYDRLIGDTEFNFSGARYQHTRLTGLQLVKHQESFKYMRIGCDYVKIIESPNAFGVITSKIIGWKKGEITMDYVNKGVKNFFDTIDKYDEFCNIPCNTDAFLQCAHGCYNMYYKLDHVLEPGEWPVIEGYLKHVFGEKEVEPGYTNYDMALDYLTLLYQNPTQKLPILCLVNKQRGTGKSTMLWLLKEMFQNNTTFIGNEELKDHLNDDWATKLIVGIDEGFIDKKTTLERLKSMSTSHTIKLRGMYKGRQEISFFAKFVLTSNDEANFVSLEEEETRFWVNKVPVLKEDDPQILKKMVAEIASFLQFLSTRQVVAPEKSRHWFHPELLKTEALQKVKDNSRGWLYSELSEVLKELFVHFRYHTLNYTITDISKLLNNSESSTKFRKADIAKQLDEKFKLDNPQRRVQFPMDPESQNPLTSTYEKNGRFYEFRIEKFFSEEELRRKGMRELGFDYDKIIALRTAPQEPEKDTLPF